MYLSEINLFLRKVATALFIFIPLDLGSRPLTQPSLNKHTINNKKPSVCTGKVSQWNSKDAEHDWETWGKKVRKNSQSECKSCAPFCWCSFSLTWLLVRCISLVPFAFTVCSIHAIIWISNQKEEGEKTYMSRVREIEKGIPKEIHVREKKASIHGQQVLLFILKYNGHKWNVSRTTEKTFSFHLQELEQYTWNNVKKHTQSRHKYRAFFTFVWNRWFIRPFFTKISVLQILKLDIWIKSLICNVGRVLEVINLSPFCIINDLVFISYPGALD